MNGTLSAKVKAQNKAHSLVLKHVPEILDILKPFIGTKVITSNGEFFRKVYDVLPKNNTNEFLMYYSISTYSFRIVFRVCEPSTRSCVYADATYYIGNIDNGNILQSLYNPPTTKEWRTDYTEQEIIDARLEAVKAREVLNKAQLKYQHFGEYDN